MTLFFLAAAWRVSAGVGQYDIERGARQAPGIR